MKSFMFAFAVTALAMSGLCSADRHQATSFTVTEINASLKLLQGRGGNIALSTGVDGVLIVDDDYADMSDALKKQIDRYGGTDRLKYIINTHWHGDHTGANAALGQGVSIVAHNNVRQRLSTRQEVAFFNMVSEPQPKHALPSLTYPQSMVIHFNDETITLEHYPGGHTDGDSVVFFEQAGVAHLGDLMFNDMFPFVDIGSGGNAVAYADNVGDILKKIDDNTVVIPGHGALTNKKGLETYHQMLTGTIAEVAAMKKAGLSLEQAQAKGLSKTWQRWNVGFIKEPVWISFIYNSL